MKRTIAVIGAMSVFAIGILLAGVANAQKNPAAAKVELNKATADQLGRCPGLNSTLAKAIVDFRQKSGPFKSPEDLLKVKGITKEVLDRLKPKLEKDILYVTPAAPSSDEDDEEPSLKPSKC